MIEKVPSLDTFHQDISALKSSSEGSSATGTKFQDILQQWIKSASDAEIKAQSLAHQFAIGAEEVSIHQVMIAAQKSFIAIKASTEVAKRCLNAYQEIWNMPI